MENHTKYPDFAFKPLKKTQISILRAVLRAILGKMASIFQEFSRRPPKKTKIRILYPKKYDEHTYHFTMEVPPGSSTLSWLLILVIAYLIFYERSPSVNGLFTSEADNSFQE